MASVLFSILILCIGSGVFGDVIPPKPRRDEPTCLVRGLPTEANVECFSIRQGGPTLHQLLGQAKRDQDDTETINIRDHKDKVKSLDVKGHDYRIQKDTMTDFPNIQFLAIRGQNESSTVTFDTNAFERQTKVDWLMLSSLHLQPDLADIMRPLRGTVEKLLLDNVDAHIHAHCFSDFSKLETVHVTNNALLQEVPGNHFRRSASTLTILELDNNKIRTVKADKLKDLVNLEQLRLSGNEIAQIDANAFQPLTKLKILHLSNNRLANLTPDLFRSNTNLEHLTMHGNPTTGITREQFSFLTKISHLTLPQS